MSRAILLSIVTAIAFSTGCASLSPPFDKMKDSPITVYRLQNYEPPSQTAAAAQPAASGIPNELQKWITAGASLLPPGLIPPGLIPGTQAPQTAPDAPKFHDFRILAYQPVSDSKMRDEILQLFGKEGNFTAKHDTCFFAEFGFAMGQEGGQPPADILVSLSCQQVRAHNVTWPYGNVGLPPDTSSKIASIAQRAFMLR